MNRMLRISLVGWMLVGAAACGTAADGQPSVEGQIEDLGQLKKTDRGNPARQPYYDAIQVELEKEMPYIPVYFYQTNGAYSQHVKNVKIDPFERIDLFNVEKA